MESDSQGCCCSEEVPANLVFELTDDAKAAGGLRPAAGDELCKRSIQVSLYEQACSLLYGATCSLLYGTADIMVAWLVVTTLGLA